MEGVFLYQLEKVITKHMSSSRGHFTPEKFLLFSTAERLTQKVPSLSSEILTRLELQILKGTNFKVILTGQFRAPRQLHVKEQQNKRLIF